MTFQSQKKNNKNISSSKSRTINFKIKITQNDGPVHFHLPYFFLSGFCKLSLGMNILKTIVVAITFKRFTLTVCVVYLYKHR